MAAATRWSMPSWPGATRGQSSPGSRITKIAVPTMSVIQPLSDEEAPLDDLALLAAALLG